MSEPTQRRLDEARQAYAEAHAQAEGALARSLRLAAEIERLRGLIHAVVASVGPAARCPKCAAWLRGPIEMHLEGCPWPALVAEAEKE